MNPRRACCLPCPPTTPCDSYAPCIGDECDSTTPRVIPGYVSIGRPVGPTKFDGPLWVAWHNGVVARNQSAANINLKVNAYRRKFVQEGCPSCGTLPTPTTGANCNSSGLVGAPNCKRTEYIDNFSWVCAGTVYLKGGSKDQAVCVSESPSGEKWCGVPPGPYPFVLTDCARTAATPNDIRTATSDPAWWPGENRRIAPRFYNLCNITSTAVPSNDFPQAAACAAVAVVNRCTSTTTTVSAGACIDMPITIVPGHQTVSTSEDYTRCGYTGACECGQPSSPYSCNVNSPENGALQAAWAIDIKEQKLYDALTAMGLSSTNYIGELDKVWVTITSVGRVRFLFGALSRVSAGGVLKFPDSVTISEVQNVSRSAAGESLTLTIDFTITPKNWCRYSEPCGCVHSYCENGPGSLSVTLHARTMGCGFNSECGPRNFVMSYALALGDYTVPLCAFPTACAGATPNCMQYPVTNACSGFHPTIRPDFVAAVPVERAHAGWRKYRNRYDHYICLNTIPSGQFGCCVAAKNVGSGGITHLCLGSQTRVDPAFSAAHQPCPGTAPGCILAVPASSSPPGCYPVSYNTGQQRMGPMPDGFCMPCDRHFFECGPLFLAGNCGTALYDVCDSCGTQATVTLPEVVVIDYNPYTSCSPIGTWDAYSATTATMCDRFAWVPIGYAVVS